MTRRRSATELGPIVDGRSSGQTETISTHVCSGSAQSNLIVDLEIYDSRGTQVAHNVFAGQAFAPHEITPTASPEDPGERTPGGLLRGRPAPPERSPGPEAAVSP